MKTKNVLVFLVCLICLAFSIFRIRKFYVNNVAPFEPSACIEFDLEGVGKVDAVVMTNGEPKGESFIVIFMADGKPMLYPTLIPYKALRDLKARSCK